MGMYHLKISVCVCLCVCVRAFNYAAYKAMRRIILPSVASPAVIFSHIIS